MQSDRFAATEGLTGHDRERVIARVMLGGLAAAIIGPQLVIWTRDMLPSRAFAGSFLSQALMALMVILLLLRRPPAAKATAQHSHAGRTLGQLIASPRYLPAIATGPLMLPQSG